MRHHTFATQIIAMSQADLALRDQLLQKSELNEGYHPKMEEMHLQHANKLNDIIDEIGYPTIDKVGREANEAAWLIIQHAISHPDFMKKSLAMLEIAVKAEQAD
ncbi:MAG: DUF6624 domain-containing protein, partial [Saprospiraceae bacterium]